MISIAIVDSNGLFRVSFKSYLEFNPEFTVVNDVSSVNEFPNDFNYGSINLVIFDPSDARKLDFQEIQKRFVKAKIIILSFNSNRQSLMRFMYEGISGYYSKKDCPFQFNRSIVELATSINNEEVRLGPVVRQNLIEDRDNSRKKKINLSSRELEVLKLVCMEKTNAEISDLLELSIRTIESHRRRMIDKADCRSIIGVIINVMEYDSEILTFDSKMNDQVIRN